MQNTVVVITPHPDDAEASCGGLIANSVAAGDRVVITFFMVLLFRFLIYDDLKVLFLQCFTELFSGRIAYKLLVYHIISERF
ncbi:MAG TPA: hypothetical protein DCO83_03130 [Mucilaginibacter sp.]|jgi:hypothetical protein|nr:hypothetical protein [Mucilaginibacter sp.]